MLTTPHYLKSISDDRTEIVLVKYQDAPLYEVRVYSADVPHDHRTLIATDSITEAEAIYGERAANL